MTHRSGPRLNIKTVLSTYGDFHVNNGRLIFNMGIAIPGKTVFLIETAPCVSTLAQVVACCLTALNCYLNQCSLIIKGLQRHSPESNFTATVQVATL